MFFIFGLSSTSITNPKIMTYLSDIFRYFKCTLLLLLIGTIHPLSGQNESDPLINFPLKDSLEMDSAFNAVNQLVRRAEYAEALDLYTRLLKNAEELFGPTNNFTADAYFNMGTMNFYLGQLDSIPYFYNKAIAIRKKVYGNESPLVGRIHSNFGGLYHQMGQFNKAAAHLDTAIAYYIKAEGENSTSLDFPYMNLGSVYYELDDYAKAMQYQFKSLNIHKQKINNQEDAHTGKCYLNIGNAFNGMNLPDQALEYYLMAKATFDTTLSQRDLLFAFLENNIGFCYQLRKDYTAAVKYIKSSLDRYAAQGFGAHPSLIHSKIALGSNYWRAEIYDSANVVFQSIVEVFEPVLGSQHQAVLEAKYYLLRNLVRQQKSAEAIEYYQTSKLNIENTELPDKQITEYTRIKHEYAKALYQAYRQQNETEYLLESIEVLQTAIDQLDEQQEFFSKENRGVNLSFRTDLTEELMRTLYQIANRHDQLFQVAEEAKGYFLLSSMLEAEAKRFGDVPDALLKKEIKLKAALNEQQKELLNIAPENLEEVVAKEAEIFDITRQLEALEREFETNHPDYFQLKYNKQVISIDDLARFIQPNQTLLEYFVGDSSIFIFTIGKDQYDVVEVKKDFPLDSLVRQLQNGLYGYYGKKENDRTDALYQQLLTDYLTVAPVLYDKLIAPVSDQLKREVIVVPDGVLGYLPFEALLSERPKRVADFNSYPFLLNDHRFSYCYSATLLRQMKEKRHKRQAPKSLVAFAPFYEKSYAKLEEEFGAGWDSLATTLDLPGFSEVVIRKDFIQLPNSGEEVLAASKLWNGDYFLNSDATEDRFNAVAGDYRIVHLSTHGIADPRVGDYSYLAFAEQKDSIENEYLYVRDLYNLQLNADLVVLSACETAAGELQRGEGIISLARAFAYAGAKSILTTLWVVDDAATKDLTKEFYLQLKQGKTKDEALHLAKLKHLRENDNTRKHPFFWAAMIPVGDMSAME